MIFRPSLSWDLFSNDDWWWWWALCILPKHNVSVSLLTDVSKHIIECFACKVCSMPTQEMRVQPPLTPTGLYYKLQNILFPVNNNIQRNVEPCPCYWEYFTDPKYTTSITNSNLFNLIELTTPLIVCLISFSSFELSCYTERKYLLGALTSSDIRLLRRVSN